MQPGEMRNDTDPFGFQTKLRSHGPTLVWGIWVIWGFVCMGLAHTSLVDWSGFADFRDVMKMIVPSVSRIPPADAIDPVVSSSFLALIWGSSPIAWFLFRQVPAERLFTKAAWNAPITTRIKWVMVVMVICAITAFFIDYGSSRLANRLMARDVFRFSILASLISAAPWFAIVFVATWIKRIKGVSVDKERE